MADRVIDPRLHEAAAAQPYPLVFATVSGAHLYGFASPDSDWDLRGVHLLPVADVVGLTPPCETIEVHRREPGFELDLVTHDLAKFCRLLLRPNGYVLEQLTSPWVVHTTPAHAELRALAPGCVTRHHAHHYRGFARNQWELFRKDTPPRVKPLLYVYRVLLTGIHLMRTGEIQADLTALIAGDDRFGLAPLIAAKRHGHEQEPLTDAELARREPAIAALHAELDAAAAATSLPDTPPARPAVEALVVRWRVEGLPAG